MPLHNGIGYGDHTLEKMRHLEKILSMHVSIYRVIRQKYGMHRSRYHYIDATAGQGFVPDCGLPGSPLLFLSIIGDTPYRADFIECNPNNLESLKHCIPEHATRNVQLHQGRYQDIVPDLLFSPHEQMGLIFIDPSGQIPDFSTLEMIARRRPKLEILCYLSATNIKRCANSPCFGDDQKRLIEFMQGVSKRHWMVREPVGQHQWTFLLGTNATFFKNYKDIDFYRADSQRGQAILTQLNYTNKELDEWRQPTLLDIR